MTNPSGARRGAHRSGAASLFFLLLAAGLTHRDFGAQFAKKVLFSGPFRLRDPLAYVLTECNSLLSPAKGVGARECDVISSPHETQKWLWAKTPVNARSACREGAAPSPTTKIFELIRRISVALDVESISNQARTALLASLSSTLTICARDTYEAGTDRVLQPELLRAYNELLHRVTGAALDHLLERKGYSLQDVLEMLRAFGEKNGRIGEMKWALEHATKSL
jgi:hypothetical protein